MESVLPFDHGLDRLKLLSPHRLEVNECVGQVNLQLPSDGNKGAHSIVRGSGEHISVNCVSIFAPVYSYKLLFDSRNGWGNGRLSHILLLPVVSAARYVTAAAGYSKETFVYLLRRMRHFETTWADL